jgi:hypothetical protein
MRNKRFRLHNAANPDGDAGGGTSTNTDSGANTTTPVSPAPATTTLLGGDADATQQPLDPQAQSGAQDQKPAAPAVPETYEFKLPEGVTLDSEVSVELADLSKEFGLSQEKAQKVADLGVKLSQKWAADQVTALENAGTEWAAATQGDAEIGGDKLDASLAAGQKALKELGTPELSKLLATSRLGNHPEVIRFFARVGQRVGTDGFVNGGPGAPSNPKDSRRLYSNSNMNP